MLARPSRDKASPGPAHPSPRGAPRPADPGSPGMLCYGSLGPHNSRRGQWGHERCEDQRAVGRDRARRKRQSPPELRARPVSSFSTVFFFFQSVASDGSETLGDLLQLANKLSLLLNINPSLPDTLLHIVIMEAARRSLSPLRPWDRRRRGGAPPQAPPPGCRPSPDWLRGEWAGPAARSRTRPSAGDVTARRPGSGLSARCEWPGGGCPAPGPGPERERRPEPVPGRGEGRGPSGEGSSRAGGGVLFQTSFVFRVSRFPLPALRIPRVLCVRGRALFAGTAQAFPAPETAGRGGQWTEADRGAADAPELRRQRGGGGRSQLP
ncbi:hypothetical protein HPG69_011979 [Diceros bicornis minor]|uniref:Uncharacterized protein n=1 Tax=Diceros bicornis minor TaxID=77932 RepID=A0A7J7EDZ9_DICBM|nr:hypothetical protein HPG69_011979 [Diceros bicornis minor]